MKKIIIITSIFLTYLILNNNLINRSNQKDFVKTSEEKTSEENSLNIKALDFNKNEITTFFIPLPLNR